MNLFDYETKINDFARYPHVHSHRYCALGLVGETGEVANQVKKIWRDDDGLLTESRKEKLRDELGDVLWYATRYAHHRGLSAGAITIELGARSKALDLSPVVDIFDATERLTMLSTSTVAINTDFDDVAGSDLQLWAQEMFNTIADVADMLDTNIEDVAQANVDKLTGRVERGTISGSGDGR